VISGYRCAPSCGMKAAEKEANQEVARG
jgi:hypothetical protein